MAALPDPTSSKPRLVGFEADMNKIMNAMLDTSVQQRTIVAIVGPRHVGKTYLAKEIYTSAEVQRHFDVHVWLPMVRKTFSSFPAIKHIREQLSIEDEADISNFLRGKRYCVVTDDFNVDDDLDGEIWSDILRELPDNNNGSRVLVTRRLFLYRGWWPWWDNSTPLPKLQYEVGPRSNEESLKLLLQAAFPKDPWDGCPAGEVDDLAMKFVRKCEGLPLPLRFLGGLLSQLPWKEVLGRIEAKEAAGMSFVKFAMSYRNLQYHERAEGIDFSYCSGKEILEVLAQRSMIEVTKRYSDTSIKCCRLHDPFVRLLAIHEAKEKRFVPIDNFSIVDLFDARHKISINMVKENHKFGGKKWDITQLADASCMFNFGENFPLENALMSRVLEIDNSKVKLDLPRAVKMRGELRYLDLNDLRLLPEILEIKRSDQHLRGLVVRDTTIETLPSNELLKMRSLEHLWLRNTRVCEIPQLPESLKTLDVGGTPIGALPYARFCSNLTTLVLKNTKVSEISEYFTKLKYLDVRNTFVRSLPDSLWSNLRSVLATDTLQHLAGPPGSLKENNGIINFGNRTAHYDDLETLEIVRVTNDWAKSIPKFSSSNMIKLGLSYFQNDFTPDNALDWNIITRILEDLHELSSLKIQGSNVPAEIINVRTCPSYKQKLKSLSLGGSYSLFSLKGIDLPPFLISLRLDNLEFDDDPMPILGELKKLESLQLRWLLYNAQDKRMICSNGKFPKLKRLHLSDISNLEEWSVEEGALPSITHIVIESCRNLKNLSDSLVHREKPPQELHLKVMPTGFTNLFSGLPFVKISKNLV
ncbi:Disease resistance protein (CC-NBS-LRR class) family [Rhynchospora pubera]|uniref:Disease resistance protein (CC-NBS-LRR class) family n=1 Tax=Rhynchospora pubera TaxID=906938 RepID=A0AAV8G6Z4_9POAL|nr:Disease resistance protein (CC-NBS-LRR class) family [Rhynchospora pubera]